jgi:hypothetical protein
MYFSCFLSAILLFLFPWVVGSVHRGPSFGRAVLFVDQGNALRSFFWACHVVILSTLGFVEMWEDCLLFLGAGVLLVLLIYLFLVERGLHTALTWSVWLLEILWGTVFTARSRQVLGVCLAPLVWYQCIAW